MDALTFLKSLDDNSVDAIITDPPYDFDDTRKKALHKEMCRVSKDWVLVFCPPENLWQYPSDQYFFWMKPISTKNTSKRYSRFVEICQIYQISKSPFWGTGRH